jgi:cytochrome c-type biogenesis protein CcmH/NrfF
MQSITFNRKRAAQMAIVALACVLFIGAGDDARFNKVGHQLMCVCGCSQVLLECNHVGCSYSDRMRAELSQGLTRGDSNSLILQSFVQKYGATVLAAPTTTGFNRVAWIMPFLALLAGLVLVTFVVKVWKQRTAPAYASTGGVAAAQLDTYRQKAREETEL